MIGRRDSVTADRAQALLREALHPLVADMEHVRGLTWARPLGDGVRAMVSVRGLKGDQLDVTYGICCDWVPVTWARPSTYEWPRTLRQATLHLWVDHHTVDAEDRQWISTSEGERTLRRQAREAVSQVAGRAPVWWAAVSDARGVLAEARRQAVPSDIHSPRAGLVAAFTLAHLGDFAAADAELSKVADPNDSQQLRDMLRKVTTKS